MGMTTIKLRYGLPEGCALWLAKTVPMDYWRTYEAVESDDDEVYTVTIVELDKEEYSVWFKLRWE